MSKFRTKPLIQIVDAIRLTLWEYADNPLVFKETPKWLLDAIENKIIVPEFRSEDYWYLKVTLPHEDDETYAAPGDWLVYDGAKIDVFCDYLFNFQFEPTDDC